MDRRRAPLALAAILSIGSTYSPGSAVVWHSKRRRRWSRAWKCSSKAAVPRGSPIGSCSIGSRPAAIRLTRPHLPRLWHATVQWCWECAGGFWAITITPKTPSRLCSSCWRRARSIRDPDLLGTWLYGVAFRTARKARGKMARCRRTEEEGAAWQASAGHADAADRALCDREETEALHGEIDRLPVAFRMAVVLCYFEGLTLDEAAIRLRWPAGTLRSRLARRVKSCAGGSFAAASRCRPQRSPHHWHPDSAQRLFHPSCAIPQPGRRFILRPVTL